MICARLLLALLISAFPLAGAAQDTATAIGIAEWVHPEALASQARRTAVRKLMHGDRVVLREEVETTDLGAADFFFANASRLLVGPACQVTLDRRYYDSRLDVEVKEFSLDTRLRCIAKADNIGAEPADVIVLKTPHGEIQVRNGVAMIALAAADIADLETGGGPSGRGGEGVDSPLIVAGEGFGTDGYVVLIDRTARKAAKIIRRGGFHSRIGRDGAARDVVRDRGAMARAIRKMLEGLRRTQRREEPPKEYVLEKIEKVMPNVPLRRPPLVPTNCRVLECERPRIREVEVPEPDIEFPLD